MKISLFLLETLNTNSFDFCFDKKNISLLHPCCLWERAVEYANQRGQYNTNAREILNFIHFSSEQRVKQQSDS